MSWEKDKVFNNADDFIKWLDQNFGDYIDKHIKEQHTHHTFKPDHSNYPKYNTLQMHKNMRNFHMNTNGWSDIAQNITIGKDGDIVTGRDIHLVPVSATGHNGTADSHPFAYEMIGNFDIGNDKFEGKQLESAIKISRYFYKKGKVVKFHRELLLPNGKVPKTCPGTGIEKDWFMSLVKDDKYDSPKKVVVKPVEKPVEPKKETPAPVVKVETKKEAPKPVVEVPKYPNMVFKVQSPLIHNDNVKLIQKQLNKLAGKTVVKVDSYYGNDTAAQIKIYQGKHGLKKDGVVGKITWNALF
jgi:hypothetical protein